MKILFLEDRPSRQLLFLPNKEDDVKSIKTFEDIFMPDSNLCKDIITQINQGNYEFDNNIKLILVHKSALETSGLEYINNFCKENKVKLVCFSGAISQITYNNEEYEILNINSSEFYSSRLIPFLNNFLSGNSESLLELANKDWKLSYMFLARQLIGTLALEKDEDTLFNIEDKLTKISSVLNLDFSVNIENLAKLNAEIKKIILSR